MIPSSVELTNFLSHRSANGEPVVFDFEGAVLWSVAGDNGAGKSAVFDAITWTLYNQHRGGTQDAQRLISHGADTAHVAFVFTLDGARHRVERSVRRRGSAQRAAMRWSDDDERWVEVPDTTSEGGFARWRDDLLGLSYEAFTHAVLLVQGGSDRLVASGARERFEILAQLVDLSSYRRLEERAREWATDARRAAARTRPSSSACPPSIPRRRRPPASTWSGQDPSATPARPPGRRRPRSWRERWCTRGSRSGWRRSSGRSPRPRRCCKTPSERDRRRRARAARRGS